MNENQTIDGYILLYKFLNKERVLKLVFGIIGMCCSIGLLWKFGMDTQAWVITLFALAIGVGAIKILSDGIRYWKPTRHPLIQTLNRSPQSIVWVYAITTVRLPFGIQFLKDTTIFVKLINRKEFLIRVNQEELAVIQALLNKKLPHASFGYTAEKEQWYMADPAMLLRD